MRYFTLLVIICSSVLLMSNGNKQKQYSQFDGFAFKSGGFDVLLDLPDEPYDYAGIETPAHYQEFSNFLPIPVLENSNIEIDNDKATLGRVIFYDQNMSFNRTVSCASCHDQASGFADDKAFSEGFDGVESTRNALSISDFRVSHYPNLFWDDSSSDLKEMSILPFQNSDEMGMNMSEIVDRMQETDYYPNLFSNAFNNTEITDDKIAEALTQFLVSITSFDTKYDKGVENNFVDFTDSELNGMNLFRSNCDNCHSDIVPDFEFFNDEFFFGMINFNGPHNTGLDLILDDLGVANATGNPADEGKFKTPGLKNVALSGPYMHDGRFETLEEVINFYSEELLPHDNSTFMSAPEYEDTAILPLQTGFDFDEFEKEDLLAFLHTLTDEEMVVNPMFSDPFVRVVSSVDELTDVKDFNVYPTPFTNVLHVDFNNAKGALATIKLFDLNGQLIKHGVTTNNSYLLERDDLPAGNYVVEVLLDDKISNTRVLAE